MDQSREAWIKIKPTLRLTWEQTAAPATLRLLLRIEKRTTFRVTFEGGGLWKGEIGVDTRAPGHGWEGPIRILKAARSNREGREVQMRIKIATVKASRHRNIMKFLHMAFCSLKKKHVVMDLVTGVDSCDAVVSAGYLGEELARINFQQLTYAIDNCHTRRV